MFKIGYFGKFLVLNGILSFASCSVVLQTLFPCLPQANFGKNMHENFPNQETNMGALLHKCIFAHALLH